MKKIGLAGFGFIGRFIYDRLAENGDIEITAVWDADPQQTSQLAPDVICKGPEDLGSRPVDLIVEAAHPDAVRSLWPRLKSNADLMIASMTCMADRDFRQRVQMESRQTGRVVYLPHGAVLGLDGLRDGRALLESVTITTTKHPRNLGLGDVILKSPKILFDGSTRQACERFPRNVNVHAALALAGLGFEATRSKIVADPNTDKMGHHIEVRGRGLKWNLTLESFSAGLVTGSYTPESIYRSILGIAIHRAGFCIV